MLGDCDKMGAEFDHRGSVDSRRPSDRIDHYSTDHDLVEHDSEAAVENRIVYACRLYSRGYLSYLSFVQINKEIRTQLRTERKYALEHLSDINLRNPFFVERILSLQKEANECKEYLVESIKRFQFSEKDLLNARHTKNEVFQDFILFMYILLTEIDCMKLSYVKASLIDGNLEN